MEKNMISCLETERNTFCRIHCIKINTPDPDRKYLYNVNNFSKYNSFFYFNLDNDNNEVISCFRCS